MNEISIAKPQIGMYEMEGVMEVIRSKQLTQGAKVSEFEELFAKYIGTKYAVAVNSGTAALHCAYLALGLKKGDEVITTPFTFRATISMIEAVGATPVFVDIKDDFNINEALIEDKITKKTKAIVPVHLFGKSCSMDKIMKIAKKYKLSVIEDAAQSCGAEYDNKKTGNFGDIGTFSFYGTKILTTCEGGMCVTNNLETAEKIRMIRNHGMDKNGNFKMLGYNYRMTDVFASIGIKQLDRIKSFIDVRRYIANSYNYYFDKLVKVPRDTENTKHVYNNYSFTVKNRDLVVKNLQANGIGARVYYAKPFADLPNATRIANSILSIPIRPNLSTEEMNHIIYNLQEILS